MVDCWCLRSVATLILAKCEQLKNIIALGKGIRRPQASTASRALHQLHHSARCTDDSNACLSRADPSTKGGGILCCCTAPTSLSQILNLSGWETRSDMQTDGGRASPYQSSSGSPAAASYLLTRPLVYWHHQLTTTSQSICSTNDGVVKSINLRGGAHPGRCWAMEWEKILLWQRGKKTTKKEKHVR